MAAMASTADNNSLFSYEPGDRLVVLARTLNERHGEFFRADAGVDIERFGKTCIGQSLYRHKSVFQNASDAPIWSHFELTYFRGFVPTEVIQELVTAPEPKAMELLRAEILVTTPSSFILPKNWEGVADQSELIASLEFLNVQSEFLGEYREAMLEYCGPAAAKLVHSGRFGTFRAMETAAILYQSAEFAIDWNQVHLCELDPAGFENFGTEFKAALQADMPADAEFIDTFADLGRLRTVPRWTFNEVVFENDMALAGD